MNIKLQYFHDKTLKACLEVLPIRPANIPEERLGKIVADKDPGFFIGDDGKFYKELNFVDKTCTVTELRERQEEAQESFSLRIMKLRKEVEKFKLLKEITGEPEDFK